MPETIRKPFAYLRTLEIYAFILGCISILIALFTEERFGSLLVSAVCFTYFGQSCAKSRQREIDTLRWYITALQFSPDERPRIDIDDNLMSKLEEARRRLVHLEALARSDT